MQYRIGSQLVPIFPFGNAQALTLFNDGPATLYVGSDTSTNIITGFPIGVGSTIVWDAKSPLYAIAPISQQTTLFTVENSGPSSLGTVALMDGSTIQLAPDTTVGLNPGSSVGLVPGSTVGLESGASVGLNPGSSVAVESLPPVTYQYWKCAATDTNQPTLSNTKYLYNLGMPMVTSSGSTTGYAEYDAISRYSYLGQIYPMVLTGYIYNNGLSTVQIGFGDGTYGIDISGTILECYGTTANISLPSTVYQNWIYFELVYHTTMTRVTINNDPTLRLTGTPIPDNLLGTFRGRLPGNTAGYGYSNLYLSYPSSIPA